MYRIKPEMKICKKTTLLIYKMMAKKKDKKITLYLCNRCRYSLLVVLFCHSSCNLWTFEFAMLAVLCVFLYIFQLCLDSVEYV